MIVVACDIFKGNGVCVCVCVKGMASMKLSFIKAVHFLTVKKGIS